MSEAQISVSGDTIELYEVNKLYFPKVCLVCGTYSVNTIHISKKGRFSNNMEKRKDYTLEIPMCKDCNVKINIKKNNELAKVITFSLIGLVGAIILFYFTISIFMAITIFSVPFIISYFYYRSKVKERIDLDKFIQIKTISLSEDFGDDVLQLTFLNKNYAKYLVELNLKQNKDLKLVKFLKAQKT